MMINNFRRIFRTSLLFNEKKNNPELSDVRIRDLEDAHILMLIE